MKSFTNRLLFFIMIFAFSWVIIGDLVAMHINVICDVDIQNEQPFTKTHKSDKKGDKVKKEKNSDDDNSLFSFFIEDKRFSSNKNTHYFTISYIDVQNVFCSEIINLSIGRSPPHA